jgi:high-affinity iron transporter
LPKPPAGVLSSAAARQAGAATFAAHCAICHGIHGDGQGQRKEGMSPPPANLTLPPWSEKANAPRTYVAIRDGVRGTPMTAWAMLGDRRIWELVAYIGSLKDERAR